MELNLELGQRVKELREALNLSRKDLAELLDISDYFLKLNLADGAFQM